MCGIVAVLGQRAEDKILSAMLDAIRSRGPDGRETVSSDWFSVGFCRLAIYAPDAGRQPVRSPDGDVTLAFNGEIYNCRELAQRIGVRSASEAEVLLAGYLAYGSDFVRELDGDFAVLIVNSKRHTCEIWRDRCGVKPLYYAVLPGQRVLVSSEIRGLVAHPDLALAWDEVALAERFVLSFWSAERTPFRDIRQAPPGHRVEIGGFDAKDGPLRLEEIPYTSAHPRSAAFEGDIGAACAEALARSVAKRVEHTDVLPVFLALSGGIDSTILAALARRSSNELVAITICGTPDDLDARYARMVATALDLEHHIYQVTTERLLEIIPAVVLAQPACGAFLAWFLAEAMGHIQPSARVLLCGEGADELFQGYRVHTDPVSFKRHATEALAMVKDVAEGSALLLRVRSWEHMDRATLQDDLADLFAGAQLVNRHLVPFDHGTMARGVECRVPFLDLELLRLCAQLPREDRGSPAQGKPLLRRVLGALSSFDGATRDALLGRRPAAGHTATQAARAGLRQLLERRGLVRSPLAASRIARYSRNPEDLFWLGATHAVYFNHRGRIAGMDFEALLDEALAASPE